LQRLPRRRIKRAQIPGKILVQEDPGAARFAARDNACLGTLANLLGVHPQELSGFAQIECAHDLSPSILVP